MFCACFSRQQVRLCLFLSIENLRRCVLKLPPSKYKAVNPPGSLKTGTALHLSTLFWLMAPKSQWSFDGVRTGLLRERCKLKVNIPDRNRTWEVWGGWAFWSFSPPFSPALAPRLGWPSSTRGWTSFILKIATIQFNLRNKIVDKMIFYPVESLPIDLMIFYLQQAEDARDLSLPGLV